eukprot:1552248-Prymnesium_polylepis.1
MRPSGGSQCMTPQGSEVARSSPGRSEPMRMRAPCGGVRRIHPQNQRRTLERIRRESRAVGVTVQPQLVEEYSLRV